MLNDKAKAVYDYIRTRIDEGYAPSVREICDALDIRSTSTVHRYIHLLVAEGLLDKMDNQNRAIRLHGASARSVPLISAVQDDLPLTAVEHTEGYISYVPAKQHEGALFAVRVPDDQRRDDGILAGDVIVAEETAHAFQTAAAIVKTAEGIITLKAAENETESTAKNTIVGKAVALIRYLE